MKEKEQKRHTKKHTKKPKHTFADKKNKKEMDSICLKALNKWGAREQGSIAIGEMAELSSALTRYFIQKKKDHKVVENVIDELADVSIMVNQMAIYFGDLLVESRVQEKLSRLENIVTGKTDHSHKAADIPDRLYYETIGEVITRDGHFIVQFGDDLIYLNQNELDKLLKTNDKK